MTAVAVLLASALLVWPRADRAVERVVGRAAPRRSARRFRFRADRPNPYDVAATFDLFAVCLRAGLPVSAAAAAAAEEAPSPIAEALERAAELLALGADPDTAWAADPADRTRRMRWRPVRRASGGGAIEELSTLVRRASRAGSSLADGIAELAAEIRHREADRATAAAERAGVTVSGPLGLCFLPAFVCLGIVPVVIGLASGMLGGG